MEVLLQDFTTFVHSVALTMFIGFTAYMSIQEYGNALDSFAQVNLVLLGTNANAKKMQLEEDEERHMAWEEEDQNSRKKFVAGEIVIHPDLGRGLVSHLPTKNDFMLTVEFDILNEPRKVNINDLLFIGMRLTHQTRGTGTLVRFDEAEERAHVKFDSGEYHRYQFSNWKRKMKPHRSIRTAPTLHWRQRTFKTFFRDYLLYRIDYMLSTYTFAKPLVLFACTYTLIVIGGSAYSYASEKSWLEAIWIAWTMVADPGTHTSEEEIWQRIVALGLSFGGMLVFALMIGIIADGVSSLLDDLKQGHSYVMESGHTLILGWSDKTLPFVREICLANESEGGRVIVILADRDKVQMETELQLSPEESLGTLVICRTGNPALHSDLNKVSAGNARSVVILADRTMEAEDSDARAVRYILALQGVRKSKMGHIVVEMCNVANRELGMLTDPRNVEIIVAHDMIGRLMIQCAREPGLAEIISQLVGFEGDEFYLKQCDELTGRTFGEVLFRFEDAIPIGLKPKDRAQAWEQIANSAWRKESLVRRDWDGSLRDEQQQAASPSEDLPQRKQSRKVILNPPNDYIMQEGDELVVLAEDDDTYASKPFITLPKSAELSYKSMEPCHRPISHTMAEKFLFCGWRRDIDDMILELDKVVGKGSSVTIMCTVPVEERNERFQVAGFDPSALQHIALHHIVGNPFLRRDLNKVKSQLVQFGSVLILADQSLESNIPSADSKSLASLLLLRDMISKQLAAQRNHQQHRNSTPKRLSPQTMSDAGGPSSSLSGSDGSFRSNLATELLLEAQRLPSPPPLPQQPEERPFLRTMMRNPNSLLGESKRNLLLQQQTSSSTMLTASCRIGDKFVKRLSSVGAALYFENAHQTGNTVLISELLDSRTKALIPVANVGDHVMSNEIVAGTLAMVSECRDIHVILSELLQAAGNDLHLRSALDYGRMGEKIDFWQLQSRARARGEICLGYRAALDKQATLNPREKCAKFTLSPKAMVIVISED